MITAALAIFSRVPVWLWIVAGILIGAATWVWIERGAASEWRGKAEAGAVREAALRGQVEQLDALNKANVDELGRLRAKHASDLADLSADLARARKASTRLTVIRQENARDPDAAAALADRCPALDRLLDRLRHDAGAAATNRDEDRVGTDSAPERPAAVRSGTGTAAPRP